MMKEVFEFKINELITLKLESNETFIYINNKKFIQCLRLMVNIPFEDIKIVEDITCIDEFTHHYGEYKHDIKNGLSITEEFRGHCSNIQAWVENDYNTRILQSNLSFPLLKALTEARDPIAQKRFKEEIARRFQGDYLPVIKYLLEEHYLNYLTSEELDTLFDNFNLEKILKLDSRHSLSILLKLYVESGILKFIKIIKERMLQILSENPKTIPRFILRGGFLALLNDEEKSRHPAINKLREKCIQKIKNHLDLKNIGRKMREWYPNLSGSEKEHLLTHYYSIIQKSYETTEDVLDDIEYGHVINYIYLNDYSPIEIVTIDLLEHGEFSALTLDDVLSLVDLQDIRYLEIDRRFNLLILPETIHIFYSKTTSGFKDIPIISPNSFLLSNYYEI